MNKFTVTLRFSLSSQVDLKNIFEAINFKESRNHRGVTLRMRITYAVNLKILINLLCDI